MAQSTLSPKTNSISSQTTGKLGFTCVILFSSSLFVRKFEVSKRPVNCELFSNNIAHGISFRGCTKLKCCISTDRIDLLDYIIIYVLVDSSLLMGVL